MPHGWTSYQMTATANGNSLTRTVYTRGTGPAVVMIQELPGLTQQALDLGERLDAAGFTVHAPHLFGPLGKSSVVGNTLRVLCLHREFQVFAKGQTSPVVEWLGSLCRHVAQDSGAPVGVIGMCLTGNFALSLIAEDGVVAAVASQPSLPIIGQEHLHMSPADITRSRAALDAKGPMLAFRFDGDPLCKSAKFDAITRAFNDDAQRVQLVTLPGKGHAVLTAHFRDRTGHPTRAAMDQVLGYFNERLRPAP
ncbi:Dienelactone hydrolase [Monaibacterium marinum]|uniref:Dienelactone hydrolase n=2 Tax=Pontivivens marinum TaxID=1690039 RepID=A0A2C9CS49_9RHOB|nr:Dienelactone hydrolase [Monaibacterium marinum]